jgi:hypothetical protein
MENAIPMIIQKRNYEEAQQLRTLVLSTNVNDYDTGEPIVDGNIRKTLAGSQLVDNPILSELNGAKVGRKYRRSISGMHASEEIERRRALISKLKEETLCHDEAQESIVNRIVLSMQ